MNLTNHQKRDRCKCGHVDWKHQNYIGICTASLPKTILDICGCPCGKATHTIRIYAPIDCTCKQFTNCLVK